MARMVQCVKLRRELPGLEEPPFPGELGERIYNEISQQAWEMWPEQQMILINHYGLALHDPEARKFLREQMETFFFADDSQMPEGWTEEGSEEDGVRMVNCVKLGRVLPGLAEPPFEGELGERIYNEVSQQGWELWPPQQMILINHYGLSLNDPAARQFLREQMETFYFAEGAQMPEGWTPAGTPGAKGGGPAPRKK